MLNQVKPLADPQTMDWSSRPDVQNALAVLERGGNETFRIAKYGVEVARVAGSAEMWPLESLRAIVLGSQQLTHIKADLLKAVDHSDPRVAAGAFAILLASHADGILAADVQGSQAQTLTPIEVGEIYSKARDRFYDLRERDIRNQLRETCSAWLVTMELHGGELTEQVNLVGVNSETRESQSHEFVVGRQVLEGAGTLILGMSVGSSRFNAARTSQILAWLSDKRPDALLMITDRPARHNRFSLGESASEAERYCLRKGRQLREYCRPEMSKPGNMMEVFDWDAAYSAPEFDTALATLRQLFSVSEEFRTDMLEQTQRVLSRELEGKPIDPKQVEIAVNYLFEEFAAVMVAVELSQAPVAYAYYTDWKPFQKFATGAYDGIKRNIGFIKYDIGDPKSAGTTSEV